MCVHSISSLSFLRGQLVCCSSNIGPCYVTHVPCSHVWVWLCRVHCIQGGLTFAQVFGESITAVCGGCVGTEKEEVVVSTYSGQVVGLKQDTMGVKQQPDPDMLLKIENLRCVCGCVSVLCG